MSAPLKNHGRLQSQWERMCLQKTRFTDEYVARARAQQILQSGINTPPHGKLWVYNCPNCRGWHMTSKSRTPEGKRQTLAVTAEDIFTPDHVPKKDDANVRYFVKGKWIKEPSNEEG